MIGSMKTRAGMRRAGGVAALALSALLAGCGSMNYFPPQNLGEVKKAAADLRQAKVLVSMSPQIQYDRVTRRQPGTGGLVTSEERGFWHDRLLAKIAERLAAQGVRTVTELRDLNDLRQPKLAEVIARERPDYVLRLYQERMSTINLQEAGVVWMVQLGSVLPGGSVSVLFEHHFSVAGTFCMATKLKEFAEETAMGCLDKQAEHVVARLAANHFFDGSTAAATRQPGAGAMFSEPPEARPAGSGSSLCLSQAPGVSCKK